MLTADLKCQTGRVSVGCDQTGNPTQRRTLAFQLSDWESMSPSDQDAFETDAPEAADMMKKRLYLEASGKCGKAFEVYRQMVLRDQFERTHSLNASVCGT